MKNLLEKLLDIQQVRFLLVGVLNTIVGYGVYAILVYINVNYLIANTISTIVGIFHSYLWNRFFTFQSTGRVKKEILKFVFVYFISYILGTINIAILVSKFNINKYLSGAGNLVLTTIISWVGHKYFSFREVKK